MLGSELISNKDELPVDFEINSYMAGKGLNDYSADVENGKLLKSGKYERQ